MIENKNETMNKFFVSLGLRSLAADQEAEIVANVFHNLIDSKPGIAAIDYMEVFTGWRQHGGHVAIMSYMIKAMGGEQQAANHYVEFRARFLGALQVATLNGDFNR